MIKIHQKLLKQYDFIIPTNYEKYIKLQKEIKNSTDNKNIFRLLVEYSYRGKEPENETENNAIFSVLNHKNKNDVIINPTTIQMNITPLEPTVKTAKKENIKFQLLAIKVLDDCYEKYSKSLKKDLYTFSNKFDFISNDTVQYNKKNEYNLFDIDKLKININVIVGKNGSGKSTVVELAFIIINNLAIKLFQDKHESTKIKPIEDGLHAELYFITDHIYKIIVKNQEVVINRYNQISDNNKIIKFTLDRSYNSKKFNFSNLYYTEHLNYSIHSLNENYFGKWLFKLFHKNDGYKIPIVIEPYREDGNIDINKQMALTKDRLLINLLDKEKDDKHKQLTKTAIVKNIRFSIDCIKVYKYTTPNKNSFKLLLEVLKRYDLKYNEVRFNKLRNQFIKTNKQKPPIKAEEFANLYVSFPVEFLTVIYIYNKLLTIITRYDKYKSFKDKIDNGTFNDCFEMIDEDNSHVTYKIKRAINFFKLNKRYEFSTDAKDIDIDDFTTKTINILAKNDDYIIESIIPPSIFKVDIVFNNGNTFESLSSGEKQKIFVLTVIMYHLKNIASIDKGYTDVNVVLDEIELYFHPEMQKNFISDLYASIGSNEFIKSNINAINFMFVTHSPFILSDVMHYDLMALDEYGKQKKDLKPSFGANIYNLLNDSFFMNDFIGEFAKSKIVEVINIINFYKMSKGIEKVSNLDDLLVAFNNKYSPKESITKDNYSESKKEILKTINDDRNKMMDIVENIGEKILRKELLNKLEIIDDENKEKNKQEIIKEFNKYEIKHIEKALNSLKEKNMIKVDNSYKKRIFTDSKDINILKLKKKVEDKIKEVEENGTFDYKQLKSFEKDVNARHISVLKFKDAIMSKLMHLRHRSISNKLKNKLDIVEENIYLILIGRYDKMKEFVQSQHNFITLHRSCKKKDLQKHKNYDEYKNIFDKLYETQLSNNDKFKRAFFEMFDSMNVCPYCNRNFINPIYKSKKVGCDNGMQSPDIEHFYPKSMYPFLSLSISNLLPSCSFCNKVKSNVDTLKNCISPYEDIQDFEFKFPIDLSNIVKHKIKLETKSDNSKILHLENLYSEVHEDYINDIYLDVLSHPEVHTSALQTLLQQDESKKEEWYKSFFRNYYNEENFHKHPLSKLTKDLYLHFKDLGDTPLL